MATTNLSYYDKTTIPNANSFRFGIVVSEWNPEITQNLKKGAIETLLDCGAQEKNIISWDVPGSFELVFGCKKMIQSQKIKAAQGLLMLTLAIAIGFIYFQFQGFAAIIDQGYYFTGPESSITTSYLYVLVLLHLLHLTAGIVIVLNVFFKTLKGKYLDGNTLGFELAVTFWHFLDLLWVYLFLFVSFYG